MAGSAGRIAVIHMSSPMTVAHDLAYLLRARVMLRFVINLARHGPLLRRQTLGLCQPRGVTVQWDLDVAVAYFAIMQRIGQLLRHLDPLFGFGVCEFATFASEGCC